MPSIEEATVFDNSDVKLDANFASPYYQPLIFVPQVPLMSVDGRASCGGRHGALIGTRYFNNRYGQSQYFARYRKRRRFWNRPMFFPPKPFAVSN